MWPTKLIAYLSIVEKKVVMSSPGAGGKEVNRKWLVNLKRNVIFAVTLFYISNGQTQL